MDLRQNTETSWHQEKMELLDQFDSERKEWESQWKIMQKKIEELCHEVKLRRKMNADERAKILDQKANQASMVDCSPRSLGLGQCELTGRNHRGGLGKENETEQSLPSAANQICQEQKVAEKAKVGFLGALASESLKGCEDLKTSKDERESCSGALDTALEELARVSEDLCNFQEEIRKRSNHRRMKSDSFLQEIPKFIVPDGDHMIGSEKCCPPVSLDPKNPFCTDVLQSSAVETCAADTAPLQRNRSPPLPPPRSTSRNLPTSGSEQVHESLKENFLHGSWVSQSPGEWNSGPHSNTPACLSAGKTQSSCVTCPPAQTDSSPLHDGNAGLRVWPCDFDLGSKSGPATWLQRTGSAPRKLTCETVTPDHPVGVHPDFHRNRDGGSSVTQNSRPCRNLRCGPESTARNEKLAAKTDEFNRTVFRTDRQSCELQPGHPRSPDALQPCRALISPKSEKSIVSDVSKTRAHLPVSRGNVPHNLTPKSAAALVRQGQKHMNPSSDQHVFCEHDWQPRNLSGRPRSADPRSNYGVVEKLLKTYKTATGSAMHHSKCSQDNWAQCDYDVFGATSSWHLEILERNLLQKHAARPQQATQGTDWNGNREESRTEKSSPGKGFSRPARPANRRLPSRWASRSPSAPPALRRTTNSYTTSLQSEASMV